MGNTVLRLREWREQRGLRQVDLAERAGVRQATVSDIETKAKAGHLRRLDLAVLERLAKALGITVDGLFRAPDMRQERARSPKPAKGTRRR
jgi:transcriptional regulator with XRE-family HTH domain